LFPRRDVELLEDDEDLELLLLLLVEEDLDTLLLLEDVLLEREILLRVPELLLFIRDDPERVDILLERVLDEFDLVVVGLVLELVVPILFLDEPEFVPIARLLEFELIADLLFIVLLLRSLAVVLLDVFELFTVLRLPITDILPFEA
jgi:hypothetical protein